MLTCSVCGFIYSEQQKVAYSQLTLFPFSKSLKVYKINYFYEWGLSSAGEHYAEDVGVPGSTPGDPICYL